MICSRAGNYNFKKKLGIEARSYPSDWACKCYEAFQEEKMLVLDDARKLVKKLAERRRNQYSRH